VHHESEQEVISHNNLRLERAMKGASKGLGLLIGIKVNEGGCEKLADRLETLEPGLDSRVYKDLALNWWYSDKAAELLGSNKSRVAQLKKCVEDYITTHMLAASVEYQNPAKQTFRAFWKAVQDTFFCDDKVLLK
jgi:hypothetical protein